MCSLRLVAAALGLAAVPLLPLTAQAVPPVGDCPAPFTLLDRAELLQLAEEIRPIDDPEDPTYEERVEVVVTAYDKNSDEQLCVDVREIRGNQTEAGVNFIDNVVPPRS